MIIYKCTECGWFLEEKDFNKISEGARKKTSCGRCAKTFLKNWRMCYIPDGCCWLSKLAAFVLANKPESWALYFYKDGEICLEYFKDGGTFAEGEGDWNKFGTPEAVIKALEDKEWLKA